eukprot:scaffold266_cov391-Prasinococcus_capsulatus_cf.AAC.38
MGSTDASGELQLTHCSTEPLVRLGYGPSGRAGGAARGGASAALLAELLGFLLAEALQQLHLVPMLLRLLLRGGTSAARPLPLCLLRGLGNHLAADLDAQSPLCHLPFGGRAGRGLVHIHGCRLAAAGLLAERIQVRPRLAPLLLTRHARLHTRREPERNDGVAATRSGAPQPPLT